MAHDEVLRSSIEAHDGFLFSHTGDGVVAAFSSPRSAVDAAIAAQRELELPVRMGIATGEAERRDGDYFGTVLNRAARVMAAGHGGQILVADSTAVLLSGVDLLDLGLSLNPRMGRGWAAPVICEGDCRWVGAWYLLVCPAFPVCSGWAFRRVSRCCAQRWTVSDGVVPQCKPGL